MGEPWELSAAEAGTALADGSLSATELAQRVLDRIDEVDPVLNAFVWRDPDATLAVAAESDRRRARGRSLGPLDGIPFSVKDNLFVAGTPTTWGSRLWRDFPSPYDDLPVRRLRDAGGVLLGKTNTPEFASGSHTANDLHGVTRNPVDPRLTPGGSSGGTAAAVAAGMGALGLGTDAGGSIRGPASLTGLYGLAPSSGRVAKAAGLPPMGFDFQAVGLATRTLEDLRLLLDVLTGPASGDPASLLAPCPLPVPARSRIGWLARYGDLPVDPEVVDRVSGAAEVLAVAGCEVVPVAPPYDVEAVLAVMGTLRAVGTRIAVTDSPHPEEPVTSYVTPLLARGAEVSAEAYARTMMSVLDIRRAVSSAWGEYDVLLLPTTATAAWPAEEPGPETVAGMPATPAALGAFMPWLNVVGYAGLSVPVTPYDDGRPIGVQLACRHGGEEALLAAAELLSR